MGVHFPRDFLVHTFVDYSYCTLIGRDELTDNNNGQARYGTAEPTIQPPRLVTTKVYLHRPNLRHHPHQNVPNVVKVACQTLLSASNAMEPSIKPAYALDSETVMQ